MLAWRNAMTDQQRTPDAAPGTEPPAATAPGYQPPRILRRRSVVDATLQITSSHNPNDPPNPIGGH
jgi:hypothetical protein